MTPGFVSAKSLVGLYPLLHVVNFVNLLNSSFSSKFIAFFNLVDDIQGSAYY